MSDLIDIVVRFHDPTRVRELRRCVFSLVGQSYRPLRIILALQRFTAAQQADVRDALHPLLSGPEPPELVIANFDATEPVDARSVLLNLGVGQACGRYLAFLDYDDVLYPEAYECMVGRMHETGAAVVFASVRVLRVHVYGDFLYPEGVVTPPFGTGGDLIDFFRNNFAPLHSYLIDRSRVPPALLTFRTDLLMEEDYDVMLRICACQPSDFGLVKTQLGDYYYKTDGSNTVPTDGTFRPETQKRYVGVREAIEHRKRTTFVTADIQRRMGLPADRGPISIRDLVDRFPTKRIARP